VEFPSQTLVILDCLYCKEHITMAPYTVNPHRASLFIDHPSFGRYNAERATPSPDPAFFSAPPAQRSASSSSSSSSLSSLETSAANESTPLLQPRQPERTIITVPNSAAQRLRYQFLPARKTKPNCYNTFDVLHDSWNTFLGVVCRCCRRREGAARVDYSQRKPYKWDEDAIEFDEQS
jgi:hypothetical protein